MTEDATTALVDRAREVPDDALEEAEVLRFAFRLVDEARRLVTVLGDVPAAWALAALAADVERVALNAQSSCLDRE